MEALNGEFDDHDDLDPLSDQLHEITTLDVLRQEGFLANPVAHEAEALLLAAMLAEGDASGPELEQLQPKDFDKYPELAEVMLDLAGDGHTVDRTTVEHRFDGPIPDDILDRDPPAENAEVFAEDVRFAAKKRRAVQRLAVLAMQAQNGKTPEELVSLTEDTAAKLSADADTTKFHRLGEYAQEAHDEMKRDRDQRVTGISSGLDALDRISKGWQDAELTYIAGRPSMGKTSLCLGCAKHAAKKGHRTVYISAEQNPIPLTKRTIKQEARASYDANPRNLSPDELRSTINQAVDTIEKIPFWITEESGMDIFDLKAMIRRAKMQFDADLVFFDYFQLLKKPEGNYSRKNQWMGMSSRELKDLAKELNIPLVVAAQLNREVESRGGQKRPQLSDLREAGQMEEDADMVIFVYRASKYGITTDSSGNSTEGKAELIVEKNRNRPTGTAHVAFIEQWTRFEDLTNRVHDNVDIDESTVHGPPPGGEDSSDGSSSNSGTQNSGDGAPYDPSGAKF